MDAKAHRVATNLWVGSAPTTRAHRAAIIKHFDVLVLCAEEYQPSARAFPGVEVVRCGIDDADLTRREKNRVFWGAIEVLGARQNGQRVLVTCWQGRNRSALVAAAALIFGGRSAQGAIAQVRRGRKVSHVLSNPSFVNFLRRFWREYAAWTEEA